MYREKLSKLQALVALICLLQLGGSLFGQEQIDQLNACEEKTIIRNYNDTLYVVCHGADNYPYFTVVDINSNVLRQVVFAYSFVIQVTDFQVEDEVIYMCGKIDSDSSWFFGALEIPDMNSSTSNFVYVPLNNVSRLSKIHRLSSIWLNRVLLAGENTNGDAVLIEAVYIANIGTPSYYRTYTVPLVDGTTKKYTADDMIVLDNYFVVSSHKKTSGGFSLVEPGKVWFVDRPTGSNHINTSIVRYVNTHFNTTNPVYLAKRSGTHFYASGTQNILIPRAEVSWYNEMTHQKTVTLSRVSTSKGIAYNPISDNLEMLVVSDKVYSFDGSLSVPGDSVCGHQFSENNLHSLIPNSLSGNNYVISGIGTIPNVSNFNKLFWYNRNQWGDCSTQISSSVTAAIGYDSVYSAVNNPLVGTGYDVYGIGIRKESIKTTICGQTTKPE